MKNKRIGNPLFWILCAVLSGWFSPLLAQEEGKTLPGNELIESFKKADELYKEAERFYQQGRIDTSLKILERIIENRKIIGRSSRSTRAKVYRLAAHASFILERPAKAKLYIKQMLAFQPNYKYDNTNDDDLLRFTTAVDTLYALPRLSAGLRAGMNTTFVRQHQNYSVFDTEPGGSYKSSLKGFQFGLIGQYALTRNLSIALEPGFAQLFFSYQRDPKSMLGSYSFEQQISYIEAPILLKYNFFVRSIYKEPLPVFKNIKFLSWLTKPTIMPYIEIGATYKHLLVSNKSTSGTSIPVTPLLRSYDLAATAGAGFTLYMKDFSLGLDARYLFSLWQASSQKMRNLNDPQASQFIYRYYDMMDDFSLQNIQFALTFRFYISHKVFRQ